MDLNLLALFVTVVEEESLSAAARKLDLPVSSVSRGITRLEEQLQTQLLIRTTRRITKTAAGEALYERISPQLASLQDEVEKTLAEEETPSGDLRITAPVELGPTFLAHAVARFTARYPEVNVHANLSNQVLDLAKEGIDVALRFSSATLKDSSLMAKRLSPLVGHLYAAPAYLARRGTPKVPADLDRHDWVIFAPFVRGLKLQVEGGASLQLKPKGRVSATEILYVRALMRHGLGIGFLPAFLADEDLTAGRLVRVLPKSSLETGHLWFVRPASKHVPAKVEAFRDFLVEHLRTHPLGSQPGLGD